MSLGRQPSFHTNNIQRWEAILNGKNSYLGIICAEWFQGSQVMWLYEITGNIHMSRDSRSTIYSGKKNWKDWGSELINRERRYTKGFKITSTWQRQRWLTRVLPTYTTISSDKLLSTKYPKGSKECRWKPVSMNGLKHTKQDVISYGLSSPFVREMVKVWSSGNKATPHDWLQ